MEPLRMSPGVISPTEGVYAKSIQSGKWYLASIVGQKVIGLVSFFVLVRLLVPEDYGVMAVAMLVPGLLNQFTDLSFGDSLTQRKESIEPYLDAYWTLDILRTFTIAVIVFVGAGITTVFFHVPAAYVWLLRVSGILLIVSALGNIRQIYLFKQLDFKKVFYRDMVGQIAFTLSAIVFALWVQASVWALFAGTLAQYIVGVFSSYVLYPSRPALSFRFGHLRDLLNYSKWVYGQNILDLVIAQFDRIVVGHTLNPSELGIYAKGKDLAGMPTSIMATIMGKVGLPAFSKIQDRIEKVRIGFLKSVDVLALSSLPVSLITLLEGGAIVLLFLGPKWQAIVLPLKIFAFGNLFIAFTRAVNPVFGALARPDINFKTNMLQAIVSVPLMYVGIRYAGLPGLAAAIVFTWIVMLVYVVLKARPILNIPKRDFYPVITSATLASAGVIVADVATRAAFHSQTSGFVTFLWLAAMGILYYAILMLMGRVQRQGPWHTIMSILREVGIMKRI